MANSAHIFIGSSTEAKDIVAILTHELEQRGHKASPWLDSFDSSASIEASFGKQLNENDFFVLILSPDLQSTREKVSRSYLAANENVIFEAGAAYGRYGLTRTILVRDPSVQLISDLQGIKTIDLNCKSGHLNADVTRVAHFIDEQIKKAEITLNIVDSKVRWLSLMKCKPAVQRRVVQYLSQFEDEAKEKWNISYESYGVLWGPPDDFLLFSAPTLNDFIGFITGLRNELKGVLQQVDSRLVFPNKFWKQSEPSPARMTGRQLVLLSCSPENVERAYDALVLAARDEKKRGIKEVDIVTVGITTGDADVFFIAATQSVNHFYDFIEQHLHSSILKEGWLVDNSTSLTIT